MSYLQIQTVEEGTEWYKANTKYRLHSYVIAFTQLSGSFIRIGFAAS